MNREAVEKELVADEVGSMGIPVDPIDVAAQYTADVGKELLRLRGAYGWIGVRQNYKGMGRQRARRQLFVRLPTDETVDVWLNSESYEIGGVTLLRMPGSFAYDGRSPAVVAEAISHKLKILAERNMNKVSSDNNDGGTSINRQALAKELVSVARLVAGVRVNPKYVELSGEVRISQLMAELQALAENMSVWQRDGVKSVKGFGSEWIPYY